MVLSDYPHYAKFAKLTRQEEDWGLLDDPEALKRKRTGRSIWRIGVLIYRAIGWSGGKERIRTS